MIPPVILFEDQTARNFRPISWSLPLSELRLGMFNLRERVELAGGGGVLLTRPLLAGLHTCDGWHINPAELPAGGPFLWLNGRCRASVSQLEELFAALPHSAPFVVADPHGPVAAWLPAEQSARVLDSWSPWSAGDEEVPFTEVLAERGQAPTEVPALGYIFDIVPATAAALAADADLVAAGREWSRAPFGVFPDPAGPEPVWVRSGGLRPVAEIPALRDRWPDDRDRIFVGQGVRIAPGVVIDASAGPVLLDRDAQVMPFCYLEGPLYVGCGSRIKAGACIYGESSFGVGNRLAGEIGESTFLDFANKQHDGFIGHALIGSWTNLGAMTTCSDLKNNYGNVRVDLGFGSIDTGQRFVGLMLGEHAKTAIGTLFNTGTSVGFASNIFGEGMPPKFVPNFSWGGRPDSPPYAVDRAQATAEVVFGRRGCLMVDDHRRLMKSLAPS